MGEKTNQVHLDDGGRMLKIMTEPVRERQRNTPTNQGLRETRNISTRNGDNATKTREVDLGLLEREEED